MDLLKEIAEPSKRHILSLLRTGPRSVGDLVEITGMKQPNVSNHLSRLKNKGFVRSSKVGRQVYYSLSTAEVSEALAALLTENPANDTELQLNEELTVSFAKAACAGDEIECTKVVDTLLRQRESLVDIYQLLFGKSLILIGKWWEVQAVDVGQEHLASAIIERLMARVVHHAAPPTSSSMTALLGCAQGNWHTLGLRMISDVLRLSGWRTFYLGANVPNESFMSAIEEHHPYVVMISCPIPDCEEATLELLMQIKAYKLKSPHIQVGVGGGHVLANEQLFLDAGADFIGRNLGEFSENTLSRLEENYKQLNSTTRNLN